MLDSLQKDDELLANIQERWSELAQLLEEIDSHWVCEDSVCRFYHQSFKVYALVDNGPRTLTINPSYLPSRTAQVALQAAPLNAAARP
jgi:hypothetical protein